MLKRLSFFLSIILIIGLVIGIGWFIRYRNQSSTPPATEETPDTTSGAGGLNSGSNSLPRASSSGGVSTSTTVSLPPQKPFGLVADQEVAAYYPYPDGSVVIVQPGGQIMRVSGTEGTVLSSLGISNLSYAGFSYDGKKIVAAFGNPLNLQVSVFDLDKKSWEPVFARPDSSPLWSPNDYRLAFFVNNQKNKVVTIIDLQATTPKTQDIVSLNGQDLVLSWKSTNELFIGEKPSAYSSSQLFSYDLKKKMMTPILRDLAGLDTLWHTSIQQGVAFQANKNGSGGKMSLVGSDGTVARQFSFTTLPREKCSFDDLRTQAASAKLDSKTTSTYQTIRDLSPLLLCAIPNDTASFSAATLPDDYLQKDIMTEDNLIQIDLSTGDIKDLSAAITEGVDMTNLKSTATSIYFINRYNNKLYRLSRT